MSVQPNQPPRRVFRSEATAINPVRRRYMESIEAEHGLPFWEVVRKLNQEHTTRRTLAGALGVATSTLDNLLADYPEQAQHIRWERPTKLDEDDVVLIIALLDEKRRGLCDLTLEQIAEKFEVHHTCISKINAGASWKHLPRPWLQGEAA